MLLATPWVVSVESKRHTHGEPAHKLLNPDHANGLPRQVTTQTPLTWRDRGGPLSRLSFVSPGALIRCGITASHSSLQTCCVSYNRSYPPITSHLSVLFLFRESRSCFTTRSDFFLYLYDCFLSMLRFFSYFVPPCSHCTSSRADGANPQAFGLNLAKQKGPSGLSRRLAPARRFLLYCWNVLSHY